LRQRLKRLRERRDSLKRPSGTGCRSLPRDPVEFCREWLYYEPFGYMQPFLRDENHFIANVQARQTGKTFNGMAKLLHLAFLHPGSTIVVTAPKLGQVKSVAFKALHEHLLRMRTNDPELFKTICGAGGLMRTMIRLRNGSVILAESPVPETIRGHTAKAVYLMEMNFIRDDEDLYTAVLFTLNTTDGYLIAESTPWNTDSVFYRMCNEDSFSRFSRHRVVYTEALPPNGPLTPGIIEMIREQLRDDPLRWRREMLCEWTVDVDRWLPASLIALCQDVSLTYRNPERRHVGRYFVGVDFGKKRDYTVVSVLDRVANHLYLRLCHRFRLDTPYGAVIGFVKMLQDNWDRVAAVACDQTGVGEYIVEDMRRAGVRNVEGVTFTETSKEAMATALREKMRTVECLECEWEGYVEALEGEWRTTCPQRCRSREGNPVTVTPLLHLPYDPDLFNELNAPTYELTKTGRIHFSSTGGGHDDRFWSLALAVYSSQTVPYTSKPIAVRT
jgi:hypothetical protein